MTKPREPITDREEDEAVTDLTPTETQNTELVVDGSTARHVPPPSFAAPSPGTGDKEDPVYDLHSFADLHAKAVPDLATINAALLSAAKAMLIALHQPGATLTAQSVLNAIGDLRAAIRAEIVAEIAESGIYESASSSSGYSSTISYSPKSHLCHVTEGQIDRDYVERGKLYDFPFVASEWVHAQLTGDDDFHKIPSFAIAVVKPYELHYNYVLPPSGEHYCGSTIGHGETCVSGGLVPSGPLP